MTEPPRRRNNDKEAADLYPLVETAIEGIARIDSTLVAELAKAEGIHANLAPLNHVHQNLEDNVNQIIDVLEGPLVKQPFGQPPTRNDGLVDAVNEIKEALGNGGIKVKLPWPVWVAIIGALGGLAAQLIATFGDRPPVP
jgi:hypothetical protein